MSKQLTEEDVEKVRQLVKDHGKVYSVELREDNIVLRIRQSRRIRESPKYILVVHGSIGRTEYTKPEDEDLAEAIHEAIYPKVPSGTTSVRTEYEKMWERKSYGSNPFEGGMGKSKSQGGKG